MISEIVPISTNNLLQLGEDSTSVPQESLDLLRQFEMSVSIKILHIK